MHRDDMILISVDDHIVEPPDMFKNHLPKKYLDEAPRLVHNEDGSDTWQFRDVVIPNVALNAVAGGGTFLTFPALVWLGVPPIGRNGRTTHSPRRWHRRAAYDARGNLRPLAQPGDGDALRWSGHLVPDPRAQRR